MGLSSLTGTGTSLSPFLESSGGGGDHLGASLAGLSCQAALLELKPPELCPPKGPELARPWWLSSGPLEGGKKWWGSGLGVGRK